MAKWTIKTAFGGLIWLAAALGFCGLYFQLNDRDQLSVGFHRLAKYWSSTPTVKTATVVDSLCILNRDPVFQLDEAGEFQRIGQVLSPTQMWVEPGTRMQFRIHGDVLKKWDQGHLELHQPERNLNRVMKVMLTPERLQRLTAIGEQAKRRHEQEVLAELSPIFQRSLIQLGPMIEQEFRLAISNHQTEIHKLTNKYKEIIITDRLLPMVEQEVLPVVQKHARPLMEKIGSEMWQQVSLWRFAWRFFYDESLGPEESLVNKEWKRFLDNQAIPILKNHTEDFIDVQSRIISELSNNQTVRQVIRESLNEIATDAEAGNLVRIILNEGLTQNANIRKQMQEILQSQETKLALKRVGDKFEPYAVQIGQELFGSPDKVTKEFALVLRHMILKKDQQWIVWVPGKAKSTESGGNKPETAELPESASSPTIKSNQIRIYQATEIGMPPFFEENASDAAILD